MTDPSTNDALSLGFLDALEGGVLREGDQERLYRDYMRSVYVMFKSSFIYETNNAALRAACDRVATIANFVRAHVDEVASLELLAEGAYVNRTLIKLDSSTFDQSDYLHAICSALGVFAIAAIGDTAAEHWLELIGEFKRCVGPNGKLDELAGRQFRNIRLTKGADARGADSFTVTDRFRALRAYATMVIALGELTEDARNERPLRPMRIKRPMQEIVTLAKDTSALLLSLAHLKRHKLTTQHHLANTAVIAICAARPLNLSKRVVCELGLQAALHDIGRAFVIADGSVTGMVADRRFALHAVRKLVRTSNTNPRMIARVVVAHEVRRWVDRESEPPGDTEYPYSLGIPTKLVAVAHAYSLLTTPRDERPGLLPDEALRVVMRDAGRRYDRASVKLLVNVLGVYPVGSTVMLTDDRAAIVIEAPHDAAGPTRPRVKIVREADGTIVDGALLDLAGIAGADLQIVRCIDAEELEINAPAFLLS